MRKSSKRCRGERDEAQTRPHFWVESVCGEGSQQIRAAHTRNSPSTLAFDLSDLPRTKDQGLTTRATYVPSVPAPCSIRGPSATNGVTPIPRVRTAAAH